jgi:adenosine deaminase
MIPAANRTAVLSACLVLALAASMGLAAQAPSSPAPHAAAPSASHAAEARAAHAYDAAVHAGPLAVSAFLLQFPKGADLHVHLSGAVYAETFIRDAAEDGLCIDAGSLRIVAPPCDPPLVSATRLSGKMSTADQPLYDRLINALSMRSFVPSPGFSGHDHFFAAFGRTGPLSSRHIGEWVDEVASRAAAQNQQYLELMDTPPFSHAAELAEQNPFTTDFAQYRNALLAVGLKDEVFADQEEVRAMEALRRNIEHCGTPQAAPACNVQTRYIYQVLRGNSPERVFAQTLLGFEVVKATMDAHQPGFVGINFVMPEDGYLSMRDYTLQMKMVEYLHSVYPEVHISLHAGELAPGLVPPEGLRFHIRQAVEFGHAERIGHGVDVMYEDDAQGLLKEMAARHVMVEVNLTSNEGILGIKGAQHPFPLYRAAHVPVALSTDDEGVSRIEITHEYARAALDYHLGYPDLKQLARTGMEHCFLPGASLWAATDAFTAPVDACHGQDPGSDKISDSCKSFLASSEKAAAQWELERRFREFEQKF